VTAIENFWLVTHVSNDYVHASSFIKKDSSFIKKIFYQVWRFTGHVHRRLVSEICSEKHNVIHQRKRGWMTIRWSKWERLLEKNINYKTEWIEKIPTGGLEGKIKRDKEMKMKWNEKKKMKTIRKHSYSHPVCVELVKLGLAWHLCHFKGCGSQQWTSLRSLGKKKMTVWAVYIHLSRAKGGVLCPHIHFRITI
jgi:hypothetical protein